MRKAAAALLCLLVCSSCGAKQESISQRLVSGDFEKVRSALDDSWRLEESVNTTDIVSLFDNRDFRGDAVRAAFLSADANTDALVLNRMYIAADKSPYYFYFFLRVSYGTPQPEVFARSNDTNTFFGCMLEGTQPQRSDNKPLTGAAYGFFHDDKAGLENSEREFLLYLGKTKNHTMLSFLQGVLKERPDLKPATQWAINMIKGT